MGKWRRRRNGAGAGSAPKQTQELSYRLFDGCCLVAHCFQLLTWSDFSNARAYCPRAGGQWGILFSFGPLEEITNAKWQERSQSMDTPIHFIISRPTIHVCTTLHYYLSWCIYIVIKDSKSKCWIGIQSNQTVNDIILSQTKLL